MVNIAGRLRYQYESNETPFYSAEAEFSIGLVHCNEPDFFKYPDIGSFAGVPNIVDGG